MKLHRFYLDDIRIPKPLDDWCIVRNAKVCILLIDELNKYSPNDIIEISFDHDLGTDETGYDVAKWIEYNCYLHYMKCPKWKIHSANPVGRKNIENAMLNAEKYSNDKFYKGD